ncbi:MAG: hypothetical protein A3C93_06565 [Candidatus Lloydbacteria bacterium RIFCSPHIGHO2_02_FULL_54_17]|uniref:Beta-lactamase-related domain-containing protein n=1 Tax=Candidatus Lloydbacteria bacterium RIFCSPHIGHO2_02_FULL_54_17 TaxID=1798664 RepID=A0A1G2DCL7_9BACT|nr:MAG: hypothetical protein A2762_05340 [Candidatus Lloydbacteria bacterium RIFCSPHIGHO2_01_FULL_54_11]OGZ11162.1 MAG: hypothetical protein A3C93_06565 [Candidatus Lloydbacteria bacterium RIFCSPHIGHO2_02_FULL_54_17]OGZ14983.1 MAG: hypothetical protein A2948_00855 [Candidatus Lloydbacteria bacterium RIFCSPLOWO2_01_FULL_54_18]OGZ15265.1 MAG: hypothetical protein A3H76_03235 [Candidatus Lloydbacteria bacterium RIFCSPLOWO2_02_FULL_54_12]
MRFVVVACAGILLITLGVLFVMRDRSRVFSVLPSDTAQEIQQKDGLSRLLGRSRTVESVNDPPATFDTLASSTFPTLQRSDIQAALDYSASHKGEEVLIFQDGRVVAHESENGFKKGTPHRLASGTKSFSGIILAALIDDGIVPSFDAFVSGVISEWQNDGEYPAKAEVTLRQLLTLSSGLDPGVIASVPTYDEAIAYPLLSKNRGVFQYGPAPFQVFGEYVKRVVTPHGYADAYDYLTRRVLNPIGLSVGRWSIRTPGEPGMPSGAYLTATEWVKLGEFMRNGGAFNGTPLIRADLLKELTEPSSEKHPGYGITFWLTSDSAGAMLGSADSGVAIPGHGYSAAGAGNQRLIVLPDHGVVVARFGDGGPWEDKVFIDLLLGLNVTP